MLFAVLARFVSAVRDLDGTWLYTMMYMPWCQQQVRKDSQLLERFRGDMAVHDDVHAMVPRAGEKRLAAVGLRKNGH